MISIICPVTNEVIYQSMLIDSINEQDYNDYEVISLDSKELGFKCAAETLNYGASLAKGDILVFIHQDIEFLTNDALKKIDFYCNSLDFDIAGVCGVVSSGEYVVYSSVDIGNSHRHAGKAFHEPLKIYSLDECFLIIKKDKFMRFEDYGSTWHFYAVEYCMRVQKAGGNVLLLPIDIYHLSPGWSLDYSYFDTLLQVAHKYPEEKKIKTCMGVFPNNHLLPVYCVYRKFKLFVKKILKYQRKD